jgi:6-pyruvoyltetrahydropterin/6-carboxytetrahydropterin synthase
MNMSVVIPALDPVATAKPREIYRSTKSYDHSEGLSCCFRQWRATHSHCRLIHGYALAFRFVFATHELDERNWCFDFGGLKPVKAWLKEMFDHTMLVAEDDPELGRFRTLHEDGLIDIRVLPAVGCEATAKYVFDYVARYVAAETGARVWLESVEVKEHGGNSAIYSR